MNENIDLTKILEGCPKEAVFYSPLCGEVMGIKIFKNHIFAIPSNFLVVCFTFEGRASYYDGEMETFDDATDGECLLFPSKKQKNWSKFERFWDNPKVEKFDPKTLQPFDKVLVKDDYEIWQVEFFSHISQREPEGWCQCSGDRYYFCIPYNEETKHLVGAKEDCPEYYKWWEE